MNPDLIHWRAQLTPDRPALWCAGRWLNYAQLDQRATRLARRLQGAGVRRGDRVGILALNHVAHFDLLLAAPKLGFIYTPFNYRLCAQEQQQLADDVRPALLLVDARHAGLASGLRCPVQRLDAYEDWLAGAPAEPLPAAGLGAEDLHMLLFTGGSTGLPKAACLPYRQTLGNCVRTVDAWSLTAADCAIQVTPCFHAALNVLATPLLYAGGRVVLMPQFDAGQYLALAATHGATRLFMVPTMYQMLAEHPDFARADLQQVRWAISGGAACPPALREAYARRGIPLHQGFGMTEAGVNCFVTRPAEAAQWPDTVGRPLPGTEAVIRRADGHPCAVDEIGELTLRGPHLCAGYFERPQEWARACRDGWLWTGDLARCNAQGLYFIAGRAKEMFISGGENVYPLEVEAALGQCRGVAECAVLGIPHPKWGEVGLAAVVMQPGHAPDAEALRAELRSRLAGYKVPREFFFLPGLPKTGAGKLARPEIRRLYARSAPQEQCA
ncbi:MAG: AMP-binding protein [Gammaproteobacteria bacterium]